MFFRRKPKVESSAAEELQSAFRKALWDEYDTLVKTQKPSTLTDRLLVLNFKATMLVK